MTAFCVSSRLNACSADLFRVIRDFQSTLRPFDKLRTPQAQDTAIFNFQFSIFNPTMFPAPLSAEALEESMFKITQKCANTPKAAITAIEKAGKSSLRHAVYGENVVKFSTRTDTPGIGTGKHVRENQMFFLDGCGIRK